MGGSCDNKKFLVSTSLNGMVGKILTYEWLKRAENNFNYFQIMFAKK